jgi:hypothetical protein
MFIAAIMRPRSTTAHPIIYLNFLEFPETTDLMGRHMLLTDPLVDRIPFYSEIDPNLIYRQPSIFHDYHSACKKTGLVVQLLRMLAASWLGDYSVDHL